MPVAWRALDYRPEHLEGVVRVWRDWTESAPNPVYGLADVVASCEDGLGVVVMQGSNVIGAAVARVERDQAWILLLAQDPSHRGEGLGSALLAGLEKRITARGVFRISALLPQAESRIDALGNSSFSAPMPMNYFERRVPLNRSDLESLGALGGELVPRGLWQDLAGMVREKQLIESRLIQPLTHQGLAARVGVRPPRSAVLFGPPGTGKTTFARAVAGRLGWPFIELHSSRLAGDADGLAGALRARFLDVVELEHAVVFIDEVDEIAGRRTSGGSVQQRVTNELLKLIPAFRGREGRLLICATNHVRELDSAFLRHGRFDYLIPIGLPDPVAREAIWRQYLPDHADDRVDVAVLAAATDRFSPADIEFAARKAAQQVFEDALTSGGREAEPEVVTDAYLRAVEATRPTVTPEELDSFERDIVDYKRV